MTTAPTVLATLKSSKHAVRVIRRVICNCDKYSIDDATCFPYEVQILSCGTHGRWSYVEAFDDEVLALRAAANKFISISV